MAAVADETVPGFFLPDGAGAVEGGVDGLGGKALPRMQEFADGHVRGGREEDVDVVGHHDEGVEAAAGAVEVTQGVLDGEPGGG